MAIAQVQFTSQESKMAGNEVEIGLLLPLNSRNRRKLLMERQTQQAAISQKEIVFRFRKDVQSEKGWGLISCA